MLIFLCNHVASCQPFELNEYVHTHHNLFTESELQPLSIRRAGSVICYYITRGHIKLKFQNRQSTPCPEFLDCVLRVVGGFSIIHIRFFFSYTSLPSLLM